MSRIGLVLLALGAVLVPLFHWCELCRWQLGLVALGVCVISSLVAHLVGEYPTSQDNFAVRIAGSMGFRTAPPFLAVVVVKVAPVFSFEAGFVFLIILFYLVGLIVDVTLQVAQLKTSE